jgi:hypothetical protein
MNTKVTNIARYLLGIAMLVFGANKFYPFMPNPELPEAAGVFMGALINSGYIFPILGIVYILAGLCLVENKAVPFTLVLLVPVSVNIVTFHLKFASIVAALNILLIYANWDRFKTIFN